jgi:membrane-bound serine protease (ClpP class)
MPLLALSLFFFLPWPLAVVLYVPISGASLYGYWKIRQKVKQAQRLPPVIGETAMIGDQARVVRMAHGEAEVRYRGETWQAVSSQPLTPGQQVVIEDVDGLTLRVAALPASDDESRRMG